MFFPERVLELPTVGEAPTDDGVVQLRAAALDAYKVDQYVLFPLPFPGNLSPFHDRITHPLTLATGLQRPLPFNRVTEAPISESNLNANNIWIGAH